MGIYCKLLFAVAAILLVHTAKSEYAGESEINGPLVGRYLAEEKLYSNYASEQDSSYDDLDGDIAELEMNPESSIIPNEEGGYKSPDYDQDGDGYEAEMEMNPESNLVPNEEGGYESPDNDQDGDGFEAEMEMNPESSLVPNEEGGYISPDYDQDGDGFQADAEDYNYDMEDQDEMASEQSNSAIKLLKNALNFGISELKKLGNKAICNTIFKRCKSINGGSCTKSGSTIIFKAKKNARPPLSSLLFKFRAPFSLYLEYSSYDCNSHDIQIIIASSVKFTIIPNFMAISGLSVTLGVQVTSPSTTLKLKISGKWTIRRLVILIVATYDISTDITTINAHPKKGTSIASFIKSITGLSLPVSPSSTVSFQFNGEIVKGGATTMTLVSDKGKVKFFAVYQSLKSGSVPAKAIAVEVPKLRLSSVIKKYVGIDISSIPFFGKFTVPNMGVSYATAAVKNLGSIFQNTKLLTIYNGEIVSGFSALIKVPFSRDPLLVTYSNKKLLISTPKKNLRLTAILKYVASGGGDWKLSLPSKLKRIFNLIIYGIVIKDGVTTITVKVPGQIDFFNGILIVSKVVAAIIIKKTSPKVSAAISGYVKLGDCNFATKLAQNKNNKYVLSAKCKKLSITKLFQQLSAEFLPSIVSGFLKNIPFLTFVIKNPSISYTFGVTPMQLHLGGTPIIAGYSVLHMDTIVTKIDNKVKSILGFRLGTTNFAKLLKKFTKFNFGIFPLLNQPISAYVSISPISSSKLFFSGKLKSLSIKKGVTLTASMKFPKKCTDTFCKFGGRLIGHSTVLSLTATINSISTFPIQASVKNLRLGKGIILGNAGIEIVGGTNARIGLVGEVKLKIKQSNLIFAARISAGLNGLTCELSMTNCWYNPFGAKFLSICNLIASISFAPPTGITGLSYGGEIYLGYKDTGHQIHAKGYIGISLINPSQNYYYVKFSSVTIGSLLKAFRINAKIPKPLAVSGFPKGFLSSFSAAGVELPQVHVSIPIGFRLKGTLNILGLKSSADINIDLPKKIYIKVALPPIKVGRLLAMYYSSSNTRKGPYLKANVQLLPRFSVNIHASGYLKVLGISIQTSLTITNTQYKFSFTGKFLNLFRASLSIVANYGNIKKASFTVKGVFQSDLINGIQNLVKKAVKAIGDAAEKGYKAARATAEKALRSAQKAYNAARNLVNSLKNKVSSLYKKIFIAKVMASCPNHACRKATMQGWGSVFRSVTRAARRTFRRVTRVVKKGWQYASQGLKNAYNSAKSGLNRAKNQLVNATRKLNDAKNALANVANKFKDGLKVFSYIASHGLGAIISIRKIYFSVSLAVANSGHFSCGVEVQFLGSATKNYSLYINLRSLSSIAKTLKNKVLSAFKSLG